MIDFQSNKRSGNIELLRIISMMLIVTHHWAVHSGFELANSALTGNKILIQFLGSGGLIGVNCYILITGYFLCKSSFKLRKVVDMAIEISFYSIALMVIIYGFGLQKFNIALCLKSFLPISYDMYWFMTNYILLYCISPFLNKLINTLTRADNKILIFTLLLFITVIPTFLNFIGDTGYYSHILWFITLYLIGAYIRKYELLSNFSVKQCIVSVSIIGFLCLIYILAIDMISIKVFAFSKFADYFYTKNKIPVFLYSLFIFLGCLNISSKKIIHSKFIPYIASSMFAVYLIHDNIIMRFVIWRSIFYRSTQLFTSPYLIFYALLAICSVFIGSVIIDKIRIILLKSIFSRISDYITSKLFTLFNAVNYKIISKF